jgi:hypothetical protein
MPYVSLLPGVYEPPYQRGDLISGSELFSKKREKTNVRNQRYMHMLYGQKKDTSLVLISLLNLNCVIFTSDVLGLN